MLKRGFTLLELLVTISIISLLITVILPVMGAARGTARAVQCSSNLKQIGIAMAWYSSDTPTYPPGFDDTFPLNSTPPPGGYVGNTRDDRMGRWWFHFLAKNYDDKNFYGSLIRCPSRNIKSKDISENILCGNYGVNQSICKAVRLPVQRKEFIGKPLGANQIAYASETILALDCRYSMIEWYHAADSSPQVLLPSHEDSSYVPGMEINERRMMWPGHEEDMLKGRHQGKSVNVLYVDGHVERVPADELMVVMQSKDDYDNQFPLWRPK